MADAPVTQFHLQEVMTRVRPDRARHDRQRRRLAEAEHLRRGGARIACPGPRRLESGDWRGLLLTGKPLVFAAGADIDAFPGITAERAREGRPSGTRCSAGSAPSRSHARGRQRRGARRRDRDRPPLRRPHRRVARHATSRCPRSSSGSSPAGAGRSCAPARRSRGRRPDDRRQPAQAEPHADAPRRRSSSASSTTCSSRSSSSTSRSSSSSRGSRRGAASRAGGRPLRRGRGLPQGARPGRRRGARRSPAPYRALELIEGAADWTIEEGYRAEEDALAELLPGPEAQASIYAFDVVERASEARRGVPDAQPRKMQRVGVVGAGLMATQLATLFLRRLEVPVVLTDVDPGRVEQAIEPIQAELAGLAAKGRLARARRGSSARS